MSKQRQWDRWPEPPEAKGGSLTALNGDDVDTLKTARKGSAASRGRVGSVAVIGLGYVGLPLAARFAHSGTTVLALDVDGARIESLQAGRSYLRHVPSEVIRAAIQRRRLSPSTDLARVRETEAVILCLPTPLRKNQRPDLSYILTTARRIGPHLRKRSLVVLESTTYPGTTEEELRPVLEKSSGGRAGRDFYLAYSPERQDPGNAAFGVEDIPKLVGGLTPRCLRRAVALYRRAVKTVIPVSSCRVAEAAKLLENVFRGVNIALVNELKMVYAAMDLDIWEVIAAARTKPFGFMPFYPGPGLGGHCIPIDPFYLAWKARQSGQRTRFVELAGEINTAMPRHVLGRVMEALRSRRQPIRGSRVLVLGLAYKPDVDDTRESPALPLLHLLKRRGAKVAYHDPHIPVLPPTRRFPQLAGMRSIPWQRDAISAFDAVLVVTAHAAVNYRQLGRWSKCVIDTRNVMSAVKTPAGTVWKA